MVADISRSSARAATTLSITPLHDALGAAVHGVDFRYPVADSVVTQLQAAWMKYLVLVFPEQPISDQQHVEMTRYFGAPEVFHQDIIKSRHVREIFRVSNVDEDDNIMPQVHPTMRQLSSAQRWHTDSSYREWPAIGSLLHGIEVTEEGGVTSFTNMYAVYAALPAELKIAVAGRKACHDFELLSSIAGARTPTVKERAAMPPVWQPLVRMHPVTQRESLYISPIYNNKIAGMDDAEAVALVSELAEFSGQDQFVYRHKWTPHDIVMWDNRCTMHFVTPHAPDLRRVMHRTTITGEGPVLAA